MGDAEILNKLKIQNFIPNKSKYFEELMKKIVDKPDVNKNHEDLAILLVSKIIDLFNKNPPPPVESNNNLPDNLENQIVSAAKVVADEQNKPSTVEPTIQPTEELTEKPIVEPVLPISNLENEILQAAKLVADEQNKPSTVELSENPIVQPTVELSENPIVQPTVEPVLPISNLENEIVYATKLVADEQNKTTPNIETDADTNLPSSPPLNLENEILQASKLVSDEQNKEPTVQPISITPDLENEILQSAKLVSDEQNNAPPLTESDKIQTQPIVESSSVSTTPDLKPLPIQNNDNIPFPYTEIITKKLINEKVRDDTMNKYHLNKDHQIISSK